MSESSHSFNAKTTPQKNLFNKFSPKSTKMKYVTYSESFSKEPDQDLQLLLNKLKQKEHLESETKMNIKHEEDESVNVKLNGLINRDSLSKSSVNKVDARKFPLSLSHSRKLKEFKTIEDLIDDDAEIFNSHYQQLPDQNQLMIMQQQNQWFQMIQMNNGFQAQVNMYMMNQAQMNQKKHQQSKKKRKNLK